MSVDLLYELYYAINEIFGGEMDIKKIFAFNVKKYRKLLNLSQEELALRAKLLDMENRNKIKEDS